MESLWAKTAPTQDPPYHPLILHLLDVAASAEGVLDREPESTRARMAAILGLPWEHARAWLLLLIACHDIGKASPGFQSKWPELLASSGLRLPRSPNTHILHGFVSQVALAQMLQEAGWPDELAELSSDAVGCHHGSRASEKAKDDAFAEIQVGRGERLEVVRNDWMQARRSLFDALFDTFRPTTPPSKQALDGPDFMLLSGLTSFADWIGSNEAWFPFGRRKDCEDLKAWFQRRKACAEKALDAIGWHERTPLCPEPKSFEQAIGRTPRPLQQAVADALHDLQTPALLLVEAPMGEGKTEAAFFAHLVLQRRFGHRGLYVALPTKATGNAMFKRTLDFLRDQGRDRPLDLQLLHGGALLNDSFQNLKPTGIHDPDEGGEVRAGEWFTIKKRALLSEYGVGTVDQALLPILPVRHNFVRLWGLANRVVVFDEVHAYDTYTETLLAHALRWLLALGSSVVLLSATLSPSFRRTLADVVGATLPEPEPNYPRLSLFCAHKEVRQVHFDPDGARSLTVRLKAISPELGHIRAALEAQLPNGGMGLALVNTVQRAQDLYLNFPGGEPLEREGSRIGKRLSEGTEVYLLHARFPADRRQAREDHALVTFGESGIRKGRKILIATQVAEQSLDLDFDAICTDLAPIDLVLQRAGRLWRHARESRPVAEPTLVVAGLSGAEPPSFAKPLWWGSVYREDVLLRTWSLLRTKRELKLPGEIDDLVQAVYEERVAIPESIQRRIDQALVNGDGIDLAKRGQANQAIIGLPDDASWNDPARFVLYDEDEPDVHRTLVAQTRIGQDSALAVPLWPDEVFSPEATPEFEQARAWFTRVVNLTRQDVVKRLRSIGVPEGWKKSSLLRNCFPLTLSTTECWTVDATVRLDDDLGLVYVSKEIE